MYKLINKQTNQEHLCDKVTIDGFDYYVSDESIKQGSYWFDGTNIRKDYSLHLISGFDRKVIATNSPNIDIPKVVDEVKKIGDELVSLSDLKSIDGSYNSYHYQVESFLKGVKEGYNKSQETHPFSEEDMKSFGEFCAEYDYRCFGTKTQEEMLQIWKDQQSKIVYYG